ncbi:MAG TPA: asparagine synthase (glutamine-hydrolyzing) [Thermoanaerobaculia bacterium]|nr:asparagine synthase (glutamine-hydrolyzing) [Thermoanaerobaculia bacterium]
MCGIGGGLCFGDGTPRRDGLARMVEAMKERGPDDNGVLVDGPIGLAHTRLSVIDLSAAGRCPMENETGDVRVVFNGEIYNFIELREELLLLGHAFRSSSDTEVLVHGWEEWSDDLVNRIDGMFAIGVWDSRTKELFVARDRLGEKPLFVRMTASQFVFASTLNAICEYESVGIELDPRGIASFLTMSFIPGPLTAFRGVRQLPPGWWLRVDGRGNMVERRYWDLSRSGTVRISAADARDLVSARLEEAVRRQLVADVPVGGFLSGGLDSALVLATASRWARRLHTFTIGFEGAEIDERPRARLLAERYGFVHREAVVTEEDVLENLPELVWAYGQPFGDSSSIPTFFVSRLARREVTVCLSGDGGDEAFGGYRRASWGEAADKWLGVSPSWLREMVGSLPLDEGRQGVGGRVLRQVLRVNRLAASRQAIPYYNDSSWLSRIGTVAGEQLWTNSSETEEASSVPAIADRGVAMFRPFRRVLYDDYKVQLPFDFLTKVDVASMASGLEARAPFLHRPLVEDVWSLPDEYKVRRGVTKWLLREIGRGVLPSETLSGPKVGFSIPASLWWRRSLGGALEGLLVESKAIGDGWIQREAVLRALTEHRQGRVDHSTRLFLILVLELWLRIRAGRWSRRDSLSLLLKEHSETSGA